MHKYIDDNGQVTREGLEVIDDFCCNMDMDTDTLWNEVNKDPSIMDDDDLKQALGEVLKVSNMLKNMLDPLMVLVNLAIIDDPGAERIKRMIRDRNRNWQQPELN